MNGSFIEGRESVCYESVCYEAEARSWFIKGYIRGHNFTTV